MTVDWIALEASDDIDAPSTFLRSTGGNAANVAHGLARLGIDVRLAAKVGNDMHGRYLKNRLQNAGVDLDYVVTGSEPTAQCYVLTDAIGENLFTNWPRPNASHLYDIDDFDQGMFEDANLLHATGISLTMEPRRSAVVEIVDRALAHGLIVSFDAGFPTGEAALAHTAARGIMQKCHIVKVNWPELLYWLDCDQADQMSEPDLERARKLGPLLKQKLLCPVLIVTLSRLGSLVYIDEMSGDGKTAKEIFSEPYQIECIAGVGAGDAYTAWMLAELNTTLACSANKADEKALNYLLQADWQTIATRANKAGALATRTVSACDGQARADFRTGKYFID